MRRTTLPVGRWTHLCQPFAIVIVAGLIPRLFLGRIVSPVLYQMVAHDGDVLQV
ncbi:MAG: hypothetical protein WAN60_01165 [Candidatus Sulfotelmatobacter sp.]